MSTNSDMLILEDTYAAQEDVISFNKKYSPICHLIPQVLSKFWNHNILCWDTS